MKNFLLSIIVGLTICASCFAQADIVITGSNVLSSGRSKGAQIFTTTAGVTITAGQAIELTGSNTAILPIATGTSNVVSGIALNPASPGQPLNYVTSDPAFIFGGTTSVGKIVILSGSNAGGVTLSSNAATGYYVTVLGVATSGTTLNLSFIAASGTSP